MRLLSAIVLFVFLAGFSFGWWVPTATVVGLFYLAAAIAILVDLLVPYAGARRAPPA